MFRKKLAARQNIHFVAKVREARIARVGATVNGLHTDMLCVMFTSSPFLFILIFLLFFSLIIFVFSCSLIGEDDHSA